jgi:hypothetical protein
MAGLWELKSIPEWRGSGSIFGDQNTVNFAGVNGCFIALLFNNTLIP